MRYFTWPICPFSTGVLLVSAAVFAQPANESNRGTQQPPPRQLAAPATPPLPPVDFRELLGMTPSEQKRVLTDRPEPKRKLLQSKLQEYQKLSPQERESKLQLLQLHLYLPHLMKLAPTNRTEKLNQIPAEDRKLIEERLEQWDLLPPEFQKEVLEHETTLHYFLRLESGPPMPQETIYVSAPAGYQQLEEKLEQWRALKPENRDRMYEHFQRFFELPPRQKEKTLDELSDEERQQMEKSLQTFERLPPEQRRMCIESFRQLANMSKTEQDQFLKNAERWRTMSPSERQTWRNLINLFPKPGPPMPGAASTRSLPGLTGAKGTTNKLPALPGFQK